METYKFDGISVQKALEVHNRGGKVLCPKCDAELLIIASRQLAAEHKTPPGIYCPVNHEHVWLRFILGDTFKEFYRRFGRKDSDGEKKRQLSEHSAKTTEAISKIVADLESMAIFAHDHEEDNDRDN